MEIIKNIGWFIASNPVLIFICIIFIIFVGVFMYINVNSKIKFKHMEVSMPEMMKKSNEKMRYFDDPDCEDCVKEAGVCGAPEIISNLPIQYNIPQLMIPMYKATEPYQEGEKCDIDFQKFVAIVKQNFETNGRSLQSYDNNNEEQRKAMDSSIANALRDANE